MGLITGILGAPLAPLRGTVWVAEQVLEQAEEQYYDPAAIRRQLQAVDERRQSGELSEEEATALEEELIERLLEARTRRANREA